jgi:hypothetical protein
MGGKGDFVNPGWVWKTRDLVQSVGRLLPSLKLSSRNSSVSVWFMRRGEANREAPARGGASPYRAGVNADSD